METHGGCSSKGMWPLQSSEDRGHLRLAQQTQAGAGNPVAKLLVPFVHPGPPRAHPMDSTQIQACTLCSAWCRNLAGTKGKSCSAFCVVASSMWSLWEGQWALEEVENGLSLLTAQRQVPNDLPLKTALVTLIFSTSDFAEAPAQKLMNGCSRKLFLPAVGSSYFAFNCAFTCLSLITVAAVEKCSFMNNKCSLGKKPPLCFRYQEPPDPLLSALQSLVFTNTFSILLNNDNSSVFTSLNYHILWKELIKWWFALPLNIKHLMQMLQSLPGL